MEDHKPEDKAQNAAVSLDYLKLNIEIWKTIIDTQKHFNDIEMKIKNFAILILSAFIGAIGVSFKSGYTFSFFTLEIPVASILGFGAAIIWGLFYFVDVYWYHPLLRGAVKQGIAIEKQLKTDFPNINITETIGDESPSNFFFKKNVHSTGKAKIFYLGVLIVLLVASIFCFFTEKSVSKVDILPKINMFAVNMNYGDGCMNLSRLIS